MYRGNDFKQPNVVIVSIFNGANLTPLQTYFSIGDSSTSPSAVMWNIYCFKGTSPPFFSFSFVPKLFSQYEYEL